MGSYKWGYKPLNMAYKYRVTLLKSPTYNFTQTLQNPIEPVKEPYKPPPFITSHEPPREGSFQVARTSEDGFDVPQRGLEANGIWLSRSLFFRWSFGFWVMGLKLSGLAVWGGTTKATTVLRRSWARGILGEGARDLGLRRACSIRGA